METAEKLLTVESVAERLNVSPSFVYGLLSSGRLKHFVLGKGQGGKRISEAQLQDYLDGSERGGDSGGLKHIRL